MTRLILDASALDLLTKVNDMVEIVDESGKTVGYFQPAPRQEIRSPFSREELEQRRLQRTGRPLADILRDLEAR